jgi:S-(hydroxymethyl)glutathione dehydrogenase / alcohol dehydrogenase
MSKARDWSKRSASYAKGKPIGASPAAALGVTTCLLSRAGPTSPSKPSEAIPSGVLPLQQAWEFTRGGGHIVTLGFGQKGDVSFPAMLFANRGRTVHSGQQGGLNMLRDLPRYVTLVEKGLIDLKSIVTDTYPLDRTREAIQAVADRTTIGAVITFG